MAEPARRRWLIRGLQFLASIAVIAAVARDVDAARLADVLSRGSLAWLAAALAVKGLSLLVHEARLWLALPRPRPPVWPVVAIGLVAGMLNLALPARGGDLAAIALLNRRCRVPATTATAAVGLVTFLEAAVFGVFLMGLLALGAARWAAVLGPEAQQRALGAVSAITVAGIVGAAALVGLGRRGAGEGRGPLALLRRTAMDVATVFSAPGDVALHLGAAGLQVATTVAGFTLGLPAVGVDVPLPWLAASGVLAISSLAAVALPPTLGAGPAAASAAVLGALGVEPAGALAYAGAWWMVAHLPAVVLGLPGLWSVGTGAEPPAA